MTVATFSEIALGVGLGVAGSFGAWLLTLRLIRPSIEIATEISRAAPTAEIEDHLYVYRIKILNRRRCRKAIDVEVTCRVGIGGILVGGNRINYTIPVDPPRLVELPRHGSHIFWLLVHRAEGRSGLAAAYPAVAARFEDGSIRIEDMLALPKAHVVIFARCIDGFSNTPRVATRDLGRGSVAIGLYEKKSTRINRKTSKGYEIDEIRAELGGDF